MHACVYSPVCGAVHGLQGVGLRALRHHGEHVLAVVLPVARALPQCSAVQGGGHDLVEAPLTVLALGKCGEWSVVREGVGMAKGQTVLGQDQVKRRYNLAKRHVYMCWCTSKQTVHICV